MAHYSVAPVVKAGVNTANTVMWELRTVATNRVFLRELGIFIVTAPTTAPTFVLARSTNTAVPTTTVVPEKMDPADAAATALLGTVWSTAPTFTTAGPYLRLVGLPVTAGGGMIWTFPGTGLVIPISSGLSIANLNASGATAGSMSMYAVFDE